MRLTGGRPKNRSDSRRTPDCGQAVIAADVDDRMYWNCHAQAIYGWAPEEALGRAS
jgi:hypothetical protein